MSWIKNRPLNIVLRLQLLVTLMAAFGIWFFLGIHGAVSAVLGGAVSVISSAAFAIIISRNKGYTAEGTIRIALRAEAVKIILIVSMLWMVFNNYEDVNAFAFIGTFAVSYTHLTLPTSDLV